MSTRPTSGARAVTATARVAALADEILDDAGDVVAAVAAEKLHAQLAESNPDLLAAWLHENACGFLTDFIAARDRSRRTVTRHRGAARRFARAAEAGDAEELSAFAVRMVVDEDNTRRRVADMRGDDHRFVAGHYSDTGNRLLLLSAFHEQVARKVGKKRTADVMSEQQYETLFRSIVGAQVDKAAS